VPPLAALLSTVPIVTNLPNDHCATDTITKEKQHN
jgi:hypothetical protein